MKQILVQLDEGLARDLEQLVPGSSRKRSEFIRNAIARALLEQQEVLTAAAYASRPLRFDRNGWAHPEEAYAVPDSVRRRLVGPKKAAKRPVRARR
jgi:predicted transcriptional regulator